MSSPSIESLFASLRGVSAENQRRQQDNNTHGTSNGNGAQPSVSSPIASPGPVGPQPHHASAVMSPNVSTPTATGPGTPDRNSLLNILKQSHPDTPDGERASAARAEPQGKANPGMSASDLVASFMGPGGGGPPSYTSPPSGTNGPAGQADRSRSFADVSESQPSPHTQEFLMKLLNRPTQETNAQEQKVPKATADDMTHDLEDSTPSKPRDREKTNSPSPVQRSTSQGIFTYVNPFEELAASSPRNRTPSKTTTPARSGTDTPKILHRAAPAGTKGPSTRPPPQERTSSRNSFLRDEGISSSSSPAPPPLPDGRSRVEALMGIGAEAKSPETVADALGEVASQVDHEVGKALAEPEELEEEPEYSELPEEVKQAAENVQAELQKSENEGALEEELPPQVAETVKELIDGAANASPERGSSDRLIRVFCFPLKPFFALQVQHIKYDRPNFRDDAIMDIARLKKDFDQLDRTLATATKDFIVYAMSKQSGFRVIRQDDGRDKQAFTGSKDRIFNISTAVGVEPDTQLPVQTVLATGASGAVYWLPVSHGDDDIIGDDTLESQGIIFPPTPSQEESTSGGQLKTRARRSSRNPYLFAVGRGKAIHLVWANVAGSSKYLADRKKRTVDTQKYVQERSLKIATGKAGKDFTFSEDDTVIASLDKLGRLRMWDTRELTDESHATFSGTQPPSASPIEIKAPILTYHTTSPAEKAWPSSVMFVDKSRPYTRGTALRYMIVGMKQNHTLQLWDLFLGRAIQELRLPHESESDAICSVAYHYPSNMIVVGHPTRNSVYLVHLSAPRYHLPPMGQASYMERIAQKDTSLPKTGVTAIMSGFREFALPAKGQLRSIDILSQPSTATEESGNPLLFELYVMHSKGVSCIGVTREDLGYTKENSIPHSVDAVEEKIIEMQSLKEIPPPMPAVADQPASTNGEAVSNSTANTKTVVDKSRSAIPTAAPSPAPQKPAAVEKPVAQINGIQDSGATERKSKKKHAAEAAKAEEPVSPPEPEVSHAAPKKEARGSKEDEKPRNRAAPAEVSEYGNILDQEIKKIEHSIAAEFNSALSRETERLYRRFEEDNRIQQAAGEAKQDAVLRLVSKTLSENVEKSLTRIVGQNVQRSVVPAIVESTSSNLERHLSNALGKQFQGALGSELRNSLPTAIGRAFQSAEILRSVSDLVADKVAVHVENEFSSVLHGTISPAFKQLALDTSQKVAGEIERRSLDQIRGFETQHRQDSQRIEQLHGLIQDLTNAVSHMAEGQKALQAEIAQLRVQPAPVPQAVAPAAGLGAGPSRKPEQDELETLAELIKHHRYEEATIQWLQSSYQNELFDQLFVSLGPEYLGTLSPVVALSVAAAITSMSTAWEPTLTDRLHWLEECLSLLSAEKTAQDPSIGEMVPRIMEVLVQRLEALFMRVSEAKAGDPALKRIPALARRAKDIKAQLEVPSW